MSNPDDLAPDFRTLDAQQPAGEASVSPEQGEGSANLGQREIGRALGTALVLIAVALAVDGPAWQYLVNERVYEEDWGRLLRVMGFVPTWLLAGLALWLVERPVRVGVGAGEYGIQRGAVADMGGNDADRQRERKRARRRSLYLVGTVLLSGIVGELLKLVFRRRRPGEGFELYDFRSWADRPFHNGGLSMPSTHAVVAFGAAVALTKLWPRAWPVWWLLAAGCGFTRVLARAHYASDIVMAALIAAAVGSWLARRLGIGAEESEFSQAT
jgi:membrane-associated phospholipid phosphatase